MHSAGRGLSTIHVPTRVQQPLTTRVQETLRGVSRRRGASPCKKIGYAWKVRQQGDAPLPPSGGDDIKEGAGDKGWMGGGFYC